MQLQKKHIFSKKGGLQHNGFFLSTCVLQNVKSYRFFWGIFFGIFWLFFKKHYKNRHFSTFFEAKNYKKRHFWMLLSGPSWKLLSGPSWLRLKKRQLGPDNNIQNFCAQFFFSKKKRAETPIFIVFFGNRCFGKNKLGPDNNFQKGQTWTR